MDVGLRPPKRLVRSEEHPTGTWAQCGQGACERSELRVSLRWELLGQIEFVEKGYV